MTRQIQLSSSSRAPQTSLFRLEEQLRHCQAYTPHPLNDGFIFAQNVGAPGLVSALWTPYESNLDYFESTAASDAYVVSNDGPIDEALARGILHAMSLDKPVILSSAPQFDASVGTFARRVITAHAVQYIVADLAALSADELAAFIEKLPATTDYDLTQAERAGIRMQLKWHFRDLLMRPKAPESQRTPKTRMASDADIIRSAPMQGAFEFAASA